MLVLVQRMSDITGEWGDMKIPQNTALAPRKGGQPLVKTPEEFANQLVRHKLMGEYRAVTADGEVWRISVVRRDEFHAELHRENLV